MAGSLGKYNTRKGNIPDLTSWQVATLPVAGAARRQAVASHYQEENPMRDKSAIPTAQVAKAIRGAFHRADPCDCHTTAKLGEDELLIYLISRGVLSYQDVGPKSVPLEMLNERRGGHLSHGTMWALGQHCDTLEQLTALANAPPAGNLGVLYRPI